MVIYFTKLFTLPSHVVLLSLALVLFLLMNFLQAYFQKGALCGKLFEACMPENIFISLLYSVHIEKCQWSLAKK